MYHQGSMGTATYHQEGKTRDGTGTEMRTHAGRREGERAISVKTDDAEKHS